jgi:hypothetical protein
MKIVPEPQTQALMFRQGELDVFDLDNATSQIPEFQNDEEWKDQIVSGPSGWHLLHEHQPGDRAVRQHQGARGDDARH